MRYTAKLYGKNMATITKEFDLICDARRWAESYGDKADKCIIQCRKDGIISSHIRDNTGDGLRWYRELS